MKGKIRTINFPYIDWRSDRRIEEISVFFNPSPTAIRVKAATAPEIGGTAMKLPTLGETLSECSQRYGKESTWKRKPGEPDTGNVTFTHGGMSIICRFVAGKCEIAIFTKTIGEPQFSDAEFLALREANSGGEKWEPAPRLKFGGETWQSPSLSRFAVRSLGTVSIKTRGELERLGGPYGEQIRREETRSTR